MTLRLPPQNLEAEQSVLGGLLLDPEAWDEVSETVQEKDFYKPIHRKIFSAIRELNKRGEPTDLVTLSNFLMKANDLDLIGGPAYLTELMDAIPTTANLNAYAKIIFEKALIREMINVSNSLIDEAYKQEFEDIQSFLDSAESKIFALTEDKGASGLTEASELVKLSLAKLEELYANKSDVTGIASGFHEMDELTAGFQPGELIIIAARPSMGKTAFSLNVALNAALINKKKLAYFSVEMAKEQVMTRMLSISAKVPLSNLRVGNIGESAWPRLISKAASMSEASLFIDDTSGISPYEIRSKCRRLKARYGLDMIIIDYLQLMGLKQKVESREREVSEISKMLKAIAKELKVPVIALAQLNRGVEGRSDRRPMLSDLRESGSIEQDADVIGMLYREDYYDRDNPDIKGVAEVIIGKQRNGPTGTVKLKWIPDFGIFTNLDGPNGPSAPPPPQEMNRPPSNQKFVSPSNNFKNFAPGS